MVEKFDVAEFVRIQIFPGILTNSATGPGRSNPPFADCSLKYGAPAGKTPPVVFLPGRATSRSSRDVNGQVFIVDKNDS